MTRMLLLSCLAVGCGGGPTPPDAGGEPRDAGLDAAAPIDARVPPSDGGTDAHVATDAASSDAAPLPDGGPPDGGQVDPDGGRSDGGTCGAMDAREGAPCGPTERPGRAYWWNGSSCEEVHWCHCLGADCDALFTAQRACQDAYAGCGGCATDADCASGSEWCEGGRCVECDNSGLACRIACPAGWSVYTRNGCSPCACAPENDCTNDGECHTGDKCYAGAFCWGWCPPGDPSCCFGNLCSAPGCAPPPPVGCRERGCPAGERCDFESGCTSTGCFCSDAGWACTSDCGGGVCVPDV